MPGEHDAGVRHSAPAASGKSLYGGGREARTVSAEVSGAAAVAVADAVMDAARGETRDEAKPKRGAKGTETMGVSAARSRVLLGL